EAAAAAAIAGITFIPSMEVSAEDDTVHILAVNINPDTPELKAFYTSQNKARLDRLTAIVDKLKSAGVILDIKKDVLLPKLNREKKAEGLPELAAASAELLAQIRGQITRPDIARALIAAGVVKNNKEAF